jgi:hypothetical protein
MTPSACLTISFSILQSACSALELRGEVFQVESIKDLKTLHLLAGSRLMSFQVYDNRGCLCSAKASSKNCQTAGDNLDKANQRVLHSRAELLWHLTSFVAKVWRVSCLQVGSFAFPPHSIPPHEPI